MQSLHAVFKWAHIFAGIIWIGLLYFFNWVNGPFAATMDGPTKKQVVPQLLPRALFWFRWGALWTWVTGVLLLLVVFYHGGIMFDADGGWSGGAIIMVLVTFLAVVAYAALFKSPAGKDLRVGAAIGFALTMCIVWLFINIGGFSYRAYVIHTGAMFGTIMAFNVWMRIWPAQQKIIAAIRDGNPPDPALVVVAGSRSRHNTYLSIPLVWMMINQHTTVPFAASPFWLFAAILIGWGVGYLCYQKAGRVPGF